MVFMQTEIHIDNAGRIVIPKEIREEWGFTTANPIMLETMAEGIMLRPKQPPRMVEMDGMWVYDAPAADFDIVALLESIRGERA